jgi:integrase
VTLWVSQSDSATMVRFELINNPKNDPKRPPNGDLRSREYLTETEVERLMAAARKNRWGHRDATMILVAYRHGFRPAELVDLRWDQIEFASGALHVRRVKRGTPSTHPIPRGRAAGATAAAARAGAQVAVCLHVRARFALHDRRVCPHGRAGRGRGETWAQGPPAHAATCLWIRTG